MSVSLCHVGFRGKDVRNERERAPVHKSPLYLGNWLSNREKLFAFLIEQTVSTHTRAALSSGRMKPVGGIL